MAKKAKQNKTNTFTMIPANLIALVRFYPLTSHSVAKHFLLQALLMCSINLVMDFLLAAALILCHIQTLFSNIRLILSHTYPSQLTHGAVNSAFHSEQTGCISGPKCSFFLSQK